MAKATFGAGCFWHVEAAFSEVPGVVSTEAGYAGGSVKDPTYEQVCRGDTGHAEAVQVEYDPGRTSYERLLDVFWKSHNPTTPDRQGMDVGPQYRSVIFAHDEGQEKAAKDSMKAHAATLEAPIVTQIVQADAFYPAEDYHQKYLKKCGYA